MSARPAVLVTGAAGYIGGLTIAALSRRRDELSALVALDVKDAADKLDGVDYVTLSVTDDKLAQVIEQHGVDTVVHLASVVRPPKHGGDDLAYQVDVLGTKNVLEACVDKGVRRLIVTSSGAAYGYHADSPPWLTEDDPVRGNESFAYSWNKQLIEEMLADYRRTHPELAQLVFRPGTVIGETVSSPVTDLFEKPVVLGVRGFDSPFVFIWDDDVVECLERGVFGEQTGIYNLAGDGALTPREIARLLGKPYLPLPASAITLALSALQRLGRSARGPEQIDFLRYRPVLSNRRLKAEFGYTPRYSSREAFQKYAAHKAHS